MIFKYEMLLTTFREYASNGYKAEYLFLLSLISIFFGISIIITKNPVVSVLFLIGLFITISIYLMLLGLYFIGLAYLLVYVGAVSILFLFILMLINVRISELLTEGKNSIPLAIIAVISFNFTVSSNLPYSVYMLDTFSNYLTYIQKTIDNLISPASDNYLYQIALQYAAYMRIGNVNSKSWDGYLVETNHISSIGNILYTNMFIFLIIISLVLLLAMVGTIVITVKRKN